MSDGSVLLSVKNLKKYYPVQAKISKKKIGEIKAVDDISFTINKGEVFGLVGESGCGKSTAGRTIIRLEEATGGQVLYNGTDILSLNKRDMKDMRKNIQMIFQDSYSCMNPKMTIYDIISEPMEIYRYDLKKRRAQTEKLLELVSLTKEQAGRYPHELSGGQRQRVGIARALALDPGLIIADEPVSALDVSIQAQIINLMRDLQKELGLSYLFIAHDLSVVKHLSNRIGVMYLGKLVETCDKKELYENPLHPYTQALLSAVPIPDPEKKKEQIILKGDIPSPLDPPKGCRFCLRCSNAMKCCQEEEPELIEVKKGHWAACHLCKKEGSI